MTPSFPLIINITGDRGVGKTRIAIQYNVDRLQYDDSIQRAIWILKNPRIIFEEMKKLGFQQPLIRGIRTLTISDKKVDIFFDTDILDIRGREYQMIWYDEVDVSKFDVFQRTMKDLKFVINSRE